MTIEAKERAKIQDLFQRFYFENGRVGGKDLAKLESSVLAILEKISKKSYTDGFNRAKRLSADIARDLHDGLSLTAQKIAQAIESMSEEKKP